MDEASQLLDGNLTAAELTTLLVRLTHDAALRDAVSAQQLVRDDLAGLRTPDQGCSPRILAPLRQAYSHRP
jgi:negative regulator of sigma E activity